MPFKIESKQREFFHRNGYIEFESLFPVKDTDKLSFHTDQTVIKRLPTPLMQTEVTSLYSAGRDLWRDSTALRKYMLMRSLAEVAADLTLKPVIRTGCDQLFRTTTIPNPSFLSLSPLSSLTSIFPTIGGFLIRLLEGTSSSPWIPGAVGNGVFLSPSMEFNWQELFQTPNQSFLLLSYTIDKALYVHQSLDPNTHTLKNYDYGFGDHLTNLHHPVIFSHMTRQLS
ncbi:hypothetical protein [Rhabdochlamydiaceae symbiont of Dictyostelium giganteum]|uniref:hypothetical protein n=1 Tax=Rhabdochlamydiaceae symbiont of Dictyostelium giganteum TaxID=3342349 RepID=UPI0038513BC8